MLGIFGQHQQAGPVYRAQVPDQESMSLENVAKLYPQIKKGMSHAQSALAFPHEIMQRKQNLLEYRSWKTFDRPISRVPAKKTRGYANAGMV